MPFNNDLCSKLDFSASVLTMKLALDLSIHSFSVSVEDLKVQIHDTTTVATSELYLSLPNGRMMENWEQVSSCIMVSYIIVRLLFTSIGRPARYNLDQQFTVRVDGQPITKGYTYKLAV